MKVEQLIESDGHYYLVLDKMPTFVHEKIGLYYIAIDGPFFKCLVYRNDNYAKAFGGAKFEINLTDGSTLECNGKHWDCVIPKEILNLPTTSVGIGTKETLKDCYVFTGSSVFTHELNDLIKDLKPIPYWEYKKQINTK